MVDQNVAAASRHFDAQEDAGEAACLTAARASGLSAEQADSCEDCEHKCANCPWREKGVA